MTDMTDFRNIKKRVEKASDQFIYEGLSYRERWAIYRAKRRAYRELKS